MHVVFVKKKTPPKFTLQGQLTKYVIIFFHLALDQFTHTLNINLVSSGLHIKKNHKQNKS